MAAILIHLDEATFKALNQVAPAAKRKRADFIRRAIKKAIRDHEYARIREGYLQEARPEDRCGRLVDGRGIRLSEAVRDLVANLPKPARKRPVLLLSRDDAYSYLNKFIVAEITTTIRKIPVEVALSKRDGLSKPCVVNCDNLRTVAKQWLVEHISTLPPASRGGSETRSRLCARMG